MYSPFTRELLQCNNSILTFPGPSEEELLWMSCRSRS